MIPRELYDWEQTLEKAKAYGITHVYFKDSMAWYREGNLLTTCKSSDDAINWLKGYTMVLEAVKKDKE